MLFCIGLGGRSAGRGRFPREGVLYFNTNHVSCAGHWTHCCDIIQRVTQFIVSRSNRREFTRNSNPVSYTRPRDQYITLLFYVRATHVHYSVVSPPSFVVLTHANTHVKPTTTYTIRRAFFILIFVFFCFLALTYRPTRVMGAPGFRSRVETLVLHAVIRCKRDRLIYSRGFPPKINAITLFVIYLNARNTLYIIVVCIGAAAVCRRAVHAVWIEFTGHDASLNRAGGKQTV